MPLRWIFSPKVDPKVTSKGAFYEFFLAMRDKNNRLKFLIPLLSKIIFDTREKRLVCYGIKKSQITIFLPFVLLREQFLLVFSTEES